MLPESRASPFTRTRTICAVGWARGCRAWCCGGPNKGLHVDCPDGAIWPFGGEADGARGTSMGGPGDARQGCGPIMPHVLPRAGETIGGRATSLFAPGLTRQGGN